jgi:hypothetical protein
VHVKVISKVEARREIRQYERKLQHAKSVREKWGQTPEERGSVPISSERSKAWLGAVKKADKPSLVLGVSDRQRVFIVRNISHFRVPFDCLDAKRSAVIRKRARWSLALLLAGMAVVVVVLVQSKRPAVPLLSREQCEAITKGWTQAEVEIIVGAPPGDYIKDPWRRRSGHRRVPPRNIRKAVWRMEADEPVSPETDPAYRRGIELSVYFDDDGRVIEVITWGLSIRRPSFYEQVAQKVEELTHPKAGGGSSPLFGKPSASGAAGASPTGK